MYNEIDEEEYEKENCRSKGTHNILNLDNIEKILNKKNFVFLLRIMSLVNSFYIAVV